jgi:hypothetical protein
MQKNNLDDSFERVVYFFNFPASAYSSLRAPPFRLSGLRRIGSGCCSNGITGQFSKALTSSAQTRTCERKTKIK